MSDDERRCVVTLSMPESALKGLSEEMRRAVNVPLGAHDINDDDRIVRVSTGSTANEVLDDSETLKTTVSWFFRSEFPRVKNYVD